MKAFTVYPTEEIYVRYLFKVIQYYGEVNCDFETFSKLYEEWRAKEFATDSRMPKYFEGFEIFWIEDFIGYLANQDI